MFSRRKILEIDINNDEAQIEKLKREIREARRHIAEYEIDLEPKKREYGRLVRQEELERGGVQRCCTS